MNDNGEVAVKLFTLPFVAMAAANLFTVTSFASFFLFPLFISEHGGTRIDIGILMGVFALSSVLCRPYISAMIDRIGRKRSFTLGSAIMTLLPLLYLFFRGELSSFYLPLFAVRVLHGAGLAICITAAFTFAVDVIPPRRLNEGIGIFGISGLTGLAVGPVLAEAMIKLSGFRFFFIAASAIAGIAFLVHLPLKESYMKIASTPLAPFFSIFRKKKIVTVAVLAFLFGFGIAASSGFVAPLAQERELPFVSLYFVCYSFAAITTRLWGGRLADRIGESRIIPYALALSGGGLLSLMLLNNNAMLVFSGTMTGCGHGFLFPCLSALAVRDESTENRGKIMGAYTGSIDSGVFIGSMVLGYVGEFAGFNMLFLLAGLALLTGLVFFTIRMRNSAGLSAPTPG